nr:MAG TPA: hypothetical protein [Caudoviricetes sp.]
MSDVKYSIPLLTLFNMIYNLSLSGSVCIGLEISYIAIREP